MSPAIQTLMNEHRVIEQVLGSLETYVEQMEAGTPVPANRLADYANFFKNFADRCHHGKEEEQLFVAMEKRGFPKSEGPLAVMLHEHVLGRGHVRALIEMAALPQPWSQADQHDIIAHARQYIALLREHILKEDNVLFPLSLKFLPAEEWPGLEAGFEEFEQHVMGPQVHAQYHRLADELIAEYPPDPVKMAAVTHACGGCHHRTCEQM